MKKFLIKLAWATILGILVTPCGWYLQILIKEYILPTMTRGGVK